MIKVKAGVTFHPNSFKYQQIARIIKQADRTAPNNYDPTITSACDGKHHDKSKHYFGAAFDFRIRDLESGHADTWSRRLQKRLGDEYFVLLEAHHIHVQWNGMEEM